MPKKGCIISIFIIVFTCLCFTFYLYDSWFNRYKPVKFSIQNSKNVVKELKVNYPFVKNITIMAEGRPKGVITDKIGIDIVLKEIKTPEDVLKLKEDIMAFVTSGPFLETLGHPGSSEIFKVYYNTDDGNLTVRLGFYYKKTRLYHYITRQNSNFTEWKLNIFNEELMGV
jgi:hypothetical protein